ncbi:MAG: hypothetical protein ACK5UG_06110 [Synechococcaceae cyanobacterium]
MGDQASPHGTPISMSETHITALRAEFSRRCAQPVGRFGDVCARMVMQWFFGQVQILGPVMTWTMRSAQNLTVTGFFSNPVRLRICV